MNRKCDECFAELIITEWDGFHLMCPCCDKDFGVASDREMIAWEIEMRKFALMRKEQISRQRKKIITFRLTPGEFKQMKKNVKDSKLRQADFIRGRVLRDKKHYEDKDKKN